MHGILITFESDVPLDQLGEPFSQFADGLLTMNGFVSKAWLNDGTTVGGFYVFEDEGSAQSYLQSDMVAELQATPGFHDFAVRQFAVIDDLSARTGVAAAVSGS